MTPAVRLANLAGSWRTRRAIHHADGARMRFDGVSEWERDGNFLRCVETGTLWQGSTKFEARRETLWRATGTAIEVSFADGRPFHMIDGPEAHHDCPPDDYRLSYDFGAWPKWSVRWRVTGPRKNYRALTRYARVSR